MKSRIAKWPEDFIGNIIVGDCVETMRKMPAGSVNCCVTSPPYWGLRDYGVEGQLGLEKTPKQYVEKVVAVFREVKRVLRDDGTLWLNLGDSYVDDGRGNDVGSTLGGSRNSQRKSRKINSRQKNAGLPAKNLLGMPWRVAFALQSDGWYLRSDIIWAKKNGMPESVTDRPTKNHEYIFLLAKSLKYYYDFNAVRESADPANGRDSSTSRRDAPPGGSPDSGFKSGRHFTTRNKRSVWHVSTQPYSKAHFATFPPKLIEPCILAGCPKDGVVLDPFIGAGTTALVAAKYSRNFIGIELNPEYAELARRRIDAEVRQGKFL